MAGGFISPRTAPVRTRSGECPPAEGKTRRSRGGGWHPLEAPDGAFLYYKKGTFGGSLWRCPAGGGEETRVVPSVFGPNFAIAQGGLYFVEPGVNGRPPAIHYRDAASGKAVP